MSSSSLSKNNRVRGMLYGVAMGDALGIPHEFSRVSPKIKYTGIINTQHTLSVQFRFVSTTILPGSVSDDTLMTVALLESIVANKMVYDPDKTVLYYMDFANNVRTGMGKNTRKLFSGVKTVKGYKNRYEKLLSEISQCQSNGSLMRATPLVLLPEFVDDHALSNPNSVNEDCNKAYFFILKMIYKGINKQQIKEELIGCLSSFAKTVKEAIQQSFQGGRDIGGKSKGWVVHSFYVALYVFWNFDSFQDAMDYVVQIPNSDTDTNAAIAGGLCAAYIGFEGLSKEINTNKNIEIIQSNPVITKIDELIQLI